MARPQQGALPATPTTAAFGDAAAAGAAGDNAALATHRHGMPANPVTAHTALPDAHQPRSHDHSLAADNTALKPVTVRFDDTLGIAGDPHGLVFGAHPVTPGVLALMLDNQIQATADWPAGLGVGGAAVEPNSGGYLSLRRGGHAEAHQFQASRDQMRLYAWNEVTNVAGAEQPALVMFGRADLATSIPAGTAGLYVKSGRFYSIDSAGVVIGPLGAVVNFPATQVASANANVLDDYEEGAWTPVVTFATPGNLTVVYSVQQGSYTKIGRLVFVSFYITTSTFTHTSASGAIRITGLPFTVANFSAFDSYGSIWASGWTLTGAIPVPRAINNGTLLDIGRMQSATGIAGMDTTMFPTGGTLQLRGSLVYQAAS